MLGYVSSIIIIIPAVYLFVLNNTLPHIFISAIVGISVIVIVLLLLLLLVRKINTIPERIKRFLPKKLQNFASSISQLHLTKSQYVSLLLIEIAIELIGVLTIYAASFAIGHAITLTSAYIAYAFATLFILVVPVFSGFGIVEASSTIILRQLGIPLPRAIAISLLWRFGEFWLPLILGTALISARRGAHSFITRNLPAIASFLTGVVAIASIIAPRMQIPILGVEDYTLFSVPSFSRIFVLLAGFFLIVLSINLSQRKIMAWRLAVLITGVSVFAHFLKGHDRSDAIISIINLFILLITKNKFKVKSDIPRMKTGIILFFLSLSFSLLYGIVGFFYISQRAFNYNFTLRDSIYQTLMTFFTLNSKLTPHTLYGAWFLDSLSVIGIVSVAYALFSLIRPVVWRGKTQKEENEKAKQLISLYGDSSLQFFQYSADKLFFFSSSGNAVISYGISGAICIALGDPVTSNDQEFKAALAEFIDFTETNGWKVALHQVSQKHLSIYKEMKLNAIKIGEEAVVDLTNFSLENPGMEQIKSVCNKLKKHGYKTEFYSPPLSNELVYKLKLVSDEWLNIGKHRERRFTLGAFDENYIKNTPVITVEDANNKIYAFTNLIPDGVSGQATNDLMRRLKDPYGAMDFIFVNLFATLRDQGYTSFSLGMAPLVNTKIDKNLPLIERALRVAYENLNTLFSYKGLYTYKQKFMPKWEPLYIVYKSSTSLPQILFAFTRLTE